MSRRLSLFLFAFYRVRLDPLDRLLVNDGFSLSSLGRENARLSHTRVTTVDYCAFRNGPTGKRAPAVDREKRRGSDGMVKRRERERGGEGDTEMEREERRNGKGKERERDGERRR